MPAPTKGVVGLMTGFRRLGKKSSGSVDAALITDARVGPGQDRNRRERQYATLMALRIPSLVAAVFTWYVFHSVLWTAVVVGVTLPLPWIAVVLANGRGPKKDARERNTYKPAVARAQMESQLHAQLHAQLQAGNAQALPASSLPASSPQPPSTPTTGASLADDALVIDHDDIPGPESDGPESNSEGNSHA